MFTGRYTHEIGAWSNEMGVTMVPKTNEVDKTCKGFYGEKTCRQWGKAANVTGLWTAMCLCYLVPELCALMCSVSCRTSWL